MMVAITLMQQLGQLAAAAVGLTVLTTLGKGRGLESLTESADDHKAAAAIIDRIWRIVIGVGAIPAFLAIVARLTIPESPRFTLDVSHDGKQALKANQEYLGQPIFDDYDDIVLDFEGSSVHSSIAAAPTGKTLPFGSPPRAPSILEIQNVPTIGNDTAGESYQLKKLNGPIVHQGNGDIGVADKFTEVNEIGEAKEAYIHVNGRPRSRSRSRPRSVSPVSQSWAHDDNGDQNPFDEEPPAMPKNPHPFSRRELKKYFGTEGNWRKLAGVSICWCCLDVAFYGLGIGNPRVVAQIWASSRASDNNAGLPMWGNPADPTLSIYNVLYQDSLHYIITISLGSLLGSVVLLKAIDYIPRKAVLAWSFLALGITFAIVGGIYSTVVYTNLHAFLITFYALLQLLFNLGPNTIIFLVREHISFLLHPCREYITNYAFFI
jgi:PHS family inorganic phosphate transporter-like MFS transporter